MVLYSCFVGHLDKQATKADLLRVFSSIASPKEVYIAENQELPFTYGFVRYTAKEHLIEAVLKLHGTKIGRRAIRVEPSSDTPSREDVAKTIEKRKKNGQAGKAIIDEDTLDSKSIARLVQVKHALYDHNNTENPLNIREILESLSAIKPMLLPPQHDTINGSDRTDCASIEEMFENEMLSGRVLRVQALKDTQELSEMEMPWASLDKPSHSAKQKHSPIGSRISSLYQQVENSNSENNKNLNQDSSAVTVELIKTEDILSSPSSPMRVPHTSPSQSSLPPVPSLVKSPDPRLSDPPHTEKTAASYYNPIPSQDRSFIQTHRQGQQNNTNLPQYNAMLYAAQQSHSYNLIFGSMPYSHQQKPLSATQVGYQQIKKKQMEAERLKDALMVNKEEERRNQYISKPTATEGKSVGRGRGKKLLESLQ